jgi:multisubunit Na+/H+ antiporter MnhE subunit
MIRRIQPSFVGVHEVALAFIIKIAYLCYLFNSIYKNLIMKKLLNLSLLFFCLSANILAQNQATLQGKVTEAKSGDDAINAYVKLSKNDVAKATVATDFEGNYSVNVDPGTYDVEISYVGMGTQLIKGVVLNGGRITKLDVKLEENVCFFSYGCGGYKIPLIQFDNMSSGATYSSEQIMHSPVRNWFW